MYLYPLIAKTDSHMADKPGPLNACPNEPCHPGPVLSSFGTVLGTGLKKLDVT